MSITKLILYSKPAEHFPFLYYKLNKYIIEINKENQKKGLQKAVNILNIKNKEK